MESWRYLVFWFQSVEVRTPLGSAFAILPIVIVSSFCAAIAPIIVSKFGRLKYIVSFGWLIAAIGTGLVSTLTAQSSSAQQDGFQVVEGIGMGILFTTLQLACQASQSQENVGMAVAIFTFIRSFGGTFGVAICGVIFENVFNQIISRRSVSIPSDYLISGSEAAQFVPMLPSIPSSVQYVFRYIYADSLRLVWWVMASAMALGFLVSLLARDISLKGKKVESVEYGAV